MARASRLGDGAQDILEGGKSKREGGKPSRDRNNSNADFLAALRQDQADAQVETLPRIPFASIAPHPDNPKRRSETNNLKIRKLANSIRERDFIQPLVLAPRSALVEAEPSLAELIPEDKDYVALVGHRRTVAGPLAGKVDAPALIRTDNLSRTETTLLFLHENEERDDITAIEEALAYQRLADEGMSQPRIAEAMGVKQPYVNRCLALLKLPLVLQNAINDDLLNKADAHRLRQMSTENALSVWDEHLREVKAVEKSDSEPTPIRTLINRHTSAVEQQQKTSDLRALLAEQGLEELQPGAWRGTDHTSYRLKDDAEVKTAREAGTLAGAAIEDGEIVYYSGTAPPPEPSAEVLGGMPQAPRPDQSTPAGSDPEVQQRRQAAATAARRREDACRRMIQGELAKSQVEDVLVDAMLHASPTLDTKNAKLVGVWLDRQLKPGQDVYAQVSSRTHRQSVGLAVALAALEREATQLRYATDPWPPYVVRHVERLVDLGYLEPSEFDRSHLDDQPIPSE